MKRELLSQAFGNIDDSFVLEAYRPVPEDAASSSERIVHMKKKRILSIALATTLILALGATAYAIFGFRSVGTHEMPEAGEYTSLSELKQIEKTVGYSVTAPENFSNGYTFSLLTVKGEAVFDENIEVEKEFYGVHVDYSKPGSPDRYLDLNPVLGETQPEPNELRTIDGVPVKLNLDHYKIVPEDYQKTEEDLAREADGHYFITYGSESIMEYNIASVDFALDGVEYMLSDMAATEDTLDELAQMAAELIAAAK